MCHMTKSLSGGFSGSRLGLRPVEGPAGTSPPEERKIVGVSFFRTTGPGRHPSAVLLVPALLSWGPVLLRDPSHLVHLDPTDRNRPPSEGGDLQGSSREGLFVITEV